MIEHNPDTMFDEYCIHDLPLDKYCPDCFQEQNDEYLRMVNVVVDPVIYKEPDLPIKDEDEVGDAGE